MTNNTHNRIQHSKGHYKRQHNNNKGKITVHSDKYSDDFHTPLFRHHLSNHPSPHLSMDCRLQAATAMVGEYKDSEGGTSGEQCQHYGVTTCSEAVDQLHTFKGNNE